MKEFSTTAYFRIKDEKAFNKRVRVLIDEWQEYKIRACREDLDPVQMAMGEAMKDPALAQVFFVSNPERSDLNRVMAEWRSETVSPEAFRSLFSEEAPAC